MFPDESLIQKVKANLIKLVLLKHKAYVRYFSSIFLFVTK